MGHMANGAHGYNLGHMGNGKHGQRGIMVHTADRDGAPWGMGHMGITSLILEGSSPKFNST